MKRVAVVLAASLALALAACAVEKPVEVSAPRAEVKDGEESFDDAGVSLGPVALSDAKQNEQFAVEAAPVKETTSGTPANGVPEEPVRDAKEAAEDAARKIVDATLEAAHIIKEVGLGAVQSVRDSTTRSNDETGSEELAANDERVD